MGLPHNLLISILQIEIPVGGLDCWVFLSGLEVLRHCEKLTDTSQPRAQALNTANLWDYVCRKVRKKCSGRKFQIITTVKLSGALYLIEWMSSDHMIT